MSKATNWTNLLSAALAPAPERPEKGFEPLEVWMDRFQLKSASNAFLALRKLVKLGKMSRSKYRVTEAGRVSWRSAWRWNA